MSPSLPESPNPVLVFCDRRNGSALPAFSPTPASFLPGAIEILVVRLDAGPETVGALAVLLSAAERQRAARFALSRDRQRFTVAHAWLRQVLAARLGTRPEAIELICALRGKPSLAPRLARSGLRFNVSYADDVAVCALSRGSEIGVDIEAVRVIPDADYIAARFFSLRENQTYSALDARNKPLGFFNCWTRKEALLKACGDGLYYPLDRFDVSFAPGEPARVLRIDGMPGEASGWILHSFVPGPGLVGAVAARTFSDGANANSPGFLSP